MLKKTAKIWYFYGSYMILSSNFDKIEFKIVKKHQRYNFLHFLFRLFLLEL